MADVRTLYVQLTANVGAFRGQMVAAGQSVDLFGNAVSQSANELQRAEERNRRFKTSVMGMTGVVGGALVAALGAGLYMQTKLQKSMLMVATISDKVAHNMDGYTKAIVDMSTSLPQSAQELSEGLYDIVSSGIDGKQALDVLEVSAKAAAAGMTDTATASRVIVGVLNAYGMQASQASDVSDVLFQTVNKGVITFEELAQTMGQVVPTAAASGVSIDEVGSALAAMTLSGLNAEGAATALNQTMNKILAPSKPMAGAIHDIGFESGYAALSTLGLKGTIDALSKSQGAAADTALKLFPEIRAARGYMALTAAAGKNYASTFAAISDAVGRAGAAEKAYQTSAQANAASAARVLSTLQGLAINAGTVMAPVFEVLLHVLESFTSMLYAMPGPLKTMLVILAGLAGSGMLAASAFLKFGDNLRALKAGFNEVRTSSTMAATAMRGFNLALGVIGVALVAATAVYSLYSAHKRDAKAATDDFVEALKSERNGVANAGLDALVKKLADDGLLDKMKKFGVDYKTIIAGLSGDQDAWNKAVGAFDAAKLAAGTDEYAAALKRQAAAQDDVNAAQATGDPGKMAEASMALAAANKEVYDTTPKVVSGIDELEGKVKDIRGTYRDAADITATFAAGQKAAKDSVVEQHDALTRLEDKFIPWVDGAQKMTAEQKALNDTVAGFENPADALQASLEDGKASLSKFTEAMQKQVSDMQSYMTNLALLAARGRTGLVDEFTQMGPQAAGLVADAVHASGKELDKLEGLMNTKATLSTVAFQEGMKMLPIIAASKGKATVEQLAAQFTGGDVGIVIAALKTVKNSITDIPTKKMIQLLLSGAGVAMTAAQRLKQQLDGLHDKNLKINVMVTGAHANAVQKQIAGLHEANGGVVEFRRFAGGGEYHGPQIAGAGTWRTFAEPETGGEAYIPLSPFKRTGSTNVLGQVAGRFGYDLTPRGRERASYGVSRTTVIHEAPMVGSLSVPAGPGGEDQTIRKVMYEVRRIRRKGRWS